MRRRCGAALIAAAIAWGSLAASAAAQAPSGGTSGALGLSADDNGKPLNIEAENGVEWQQANHVYIARGNAKATRGQNTVSADTLYAYYRPAPPNPNGAEKPAPTNTAATNTAATSAFDTGSTQIYRMEADGKVVFATPTQNAYGDHAVYDVDQALLVMTGKNLKIVTPQDVITARDTLEWYDQKQLGVARGDAIAIRQGPAPKSIHADVLVAEITKAGENQPSKISKVDAHGHVVLISQDQIAHGDAAVYNLDTGIATLTGHVSLTRGENELRGQYGVVDTNNNVARLLPAPPSAQLTGPHPRVEGLLIPHQQPQQGAQSSPSKP
jgi:lipopolysaccharide export system protein LptA